MASLVFPTLAKKTTLSDGTTYGYIHVPAAPGKPTFLFLHGAPSSSYIWHNQVRWLPKKGFGVIAPDLLGYGDTDRPEEYEKYQFKYMMPHVHELVTKKIGVEKVIGVGHDFGSPFLSHTWTHYKSMFSGLVFIAIGALFIDTKFDPDFIIEMSQKMLGYSTQGYLKVFISPEAASLIESKDHLFDTLMYAQDPEVWKTHLGAPGGLAKFLEANQPLPVAEWITPEELETHHRILKGGYTGVFNWYKAGILMDPSEEDQRMTAEDKKITVPTMLVLANRDYATIKEVQLQSTQAVAEDLRVEELDTGHWAMWEARERVEALLEEFGERFVSV